MTTIKSDLTNKSFASRPFKEMTVSDESESHSAATVTGNMNIDFDAVNALMKSRGMPPVNQAEMQSEFNLRQQAKRGVTNQEELDLEQQIKEIRRAKATGKERLSSGAKQRIEMLCGISRMQRVVSIDNNDWVLQVLKGKDQRELWVAAAEFQGSVEFPFELRKQTLARSLVQVAGTDLEMFLGSADLEDKLTFIEDQNEELLNKLYNEFNKLVDEAKSKYAIKTDQEAAAVVDDLKK